VPIYFALDGQILLIGADPIRWFERISWGDEDTDEQPRWQQSH
jgi:hypothetical protein